MQTYAPIKEAGYRTLSAFEMLILKKEKGKLIVDALGFSQG